MTKTQKLGLVFAAVAIAAVGCSGSSSNKSGGKLTQADRSCQGVTDDLPRMDIPEATATGPISVTETATGLVFAEIDVGPVAGFSCSVKNVTVTFDAQPVSPEVRSFDIGFNCVLPTGGTVPMGGFGLYSKTALGFSLLNFAAPVSFNGQTHAHLSCAFTSPPSSANGGSNGAAGGAAGKTGGGGVSGGGGAGGAPAGVGGSAPVGVAGAVGGPGGAAGTSATAAGGFAGRASGGGGSGVGGKGGTFVGGAAGAASTGGAGGAGTAAGGSTGSGACVPGTSGWVYLMSCDFTVAGLLHECIDYYATPFSSMSLDISSRGLCAAMTGTVLTAPCGTTNSLGSCITVSSAGAVATSPQAEYARQYQYAATGITADTWRASCMTPGSTFVPAGSAATVGVPSLTCPSGGSVGSSAAGQLAFAVATVLNGEVLQCTNYVGAATEAQRQSIVSIGGMLTPCPAQNAICACTQPAGSGTFSTDATAITYTTSFNPQSGCGTSPAAGCSTSYTPPPVP